ncbi:MAG: PAS domain-containing sensor histidine kinase [Paracoccaceae bacterium]|nr:PAS domain-containing sensor histidine kinase [Paracoccaceae bacterium]
MLRLSRLKRVRNAGTIGLVVLGPVLALLTFLVLGPLEQGASAPLLRVVILADLVYVLLVAALVLSTIARMIAARRARSAGSRLHLRLTGVFALIAILPTVTVAIFAGLTINVGLEGWFSDRVRSAVGASITAAQAYREEEREDLIADAEALAAFLNNARRNSTFLSDGELRPLLSQGQGFVQRGLQEAYVIDGSGEIRTRGESSYLFDFEPLGAEAIAASRDEPFVVEDLELSEFRALVPLAAFPDRYLYVTRDVDGRILSLLDDAEETARFYTQLEAERGRIVFEFGLLYIGFAVILVLAAIWLGLWFAERLSRPVGRLAGAAQRVGAGDLDVQVAEDEGDDEIAMVGRLFNQMTRQLKGQREALLATNRQIERRRRLFDSVLSSVTSGVIGLDPDARVSFVNRSAQDILALPDSSAEHMPLALAVPEFQPLFQQMEESGREIAQGEVRLSRGRAIENLLVRIATRRSAAGEAEGFVIAFDDVTDLVSAQRMAAWGDVARRIAHEIKNPLTPIQLSAERIRRKFRDLPPEEAEALDQLVGVIVRQTGDIRRIVDEFAKFARMPEPERTEQDLVALINDAMTLQEGALAGAVLTADLPPGPVAVDVDPTLIGQALTNVIKNAGEAVEGLSENGAPEGYEPRIHIALILSEGSARIVISDNGVGLPADRSRLFEPYVTTRAKGTGLGLPIVKKIIEDHGGTLSLSDAAPLDGSGQIGASAEIVLPRVEAEHDAGGLRVAE